MSVTINGTSGVTFNDASNQTTAATGFGFKNRIINGAMVIDQRNAGASVSNSNVGVYTLDRWKSNGSVATKFTIQQTPSATETGYATRVAAGFTNYLAVTSSAATSVGSTDYYLISQAIEGLNLSDLAWGTASAATVTLSFWVRSSLTGTFGGGIQNSASNRSYPFSFVINAANTWEQKTITIAGDTSGTWLTTNGQGATIVFGLGVGTTYSGTAGAWSGSNVFSATGATSVVGTNGATFYITGVQLEKGSTATSFDYRPYGTELALCQRYYYRISGTGTAPFAAGGALTTTATRIQGSFPVSLRTTPTALEQTGTSGNYQLILAGASVTLNQVPVFDDASQNTFSVGLGYSATGSAGQAGWLRCNSTAAYLAWSAEL